MVEKKGQRRKTRRLTQSPKDSAPHPIDVTKLCEMGKASGVKAVLRIDANVSPAGQRKMGYSRFGKMSALRANPAG